MAAVPDAASWRDPKRYLWPLALLTPLLPLEAYALVAVTGLSLFCRWWASEQLSVLDSLGLALTVGVVGGIAINTAHELGHKRVRAERWLALLAPHPRIRRPRAWESPSGPFSRARSSVA